MIYHLFEYLEQFDFPGAGMFQYLSFRASFSIITSLVISMIVGKRIIKFLHRKQIGESIRDLGLHGQEMKQGTPTMGGIIILASIIIPVLLFANLTNIYIILMLVATLWLGLIGFVDDYIKVFLKDKKGLAGKFKVAGQLVLGLMIGLTIFFIFVLLYTAFNSIKYATLIIANVPFATIGGLIALFISVTFSSWRLVFFRS